MTVIQFPPRQSAGNGALEAVRDYFDNVHPARGNGATDCGAFLDGSGALHTGDHLLMWLWERGFKVVPV